MPDDLEPGRPAVEAVFVAWLATTLAGVTAVHVLAALLPPSAVEGSPPTAGPLTTTVVFVALSFAVAQALLPGPKSAGVLGLAIPIVSAFVLALDGLDPAAVVSALFVGVFLTPAAYYIAIRFSYSLGGLLRRRPISMLSIAAAASLLLYVVVRWLTLLAHRTERFPWR